jgi:hypothetical protein
MTTTVSSVCRRRGEPAAAHAYPLPVVRDLRHRPAPAAREPVGAHTYSLPVVRELPRRPADAVGDPAW